MPFLRRNSRGGTLWKIGYYAALIGGIIIVVLSLAGIFNYAISIPFHSPLAGYFGIGIISLILGIVALAGAKHVSQLLWAIALIVVGFLAGGIGGLLVLIGGLAGLASRYL